MGPIHFCDGGCGASRQHVVDLHWEQEHCRVCSRVRAYGNLCDACVARYRAKKLALPRVPESSADACRCDAALRAARKGRGK